MRLEISCLVRKAMVKARDICDASCEGKYDVCCNSGLGDSCEDDGEGCCKDSG
jgi:hypothetical protein